MPEDGEILAWKIHASDLFKEIVECNQQNGIFRAPLTIFKSILAEMAVRAEELDDPQMKLICCRLALYEISDPNSPDYNPRVFDILEKEAKK